MVGWLHAYRRRSGPLQVALAVCVVLLSLTTAARAQLVTPGSMPLCDVASSIPGGIPGGGGAEWQLAADAAHPADAAAEDAEDCGGAMCDVSAASVVAEPVVPRARGGSIRELPCEMWRLLGRDRAGRDRAQQEESAVGILPPADPGSPSAPEPLPDDVRAAGSTTVEMPPMAVAPMVARGRAVALLRAGFARAVYRPPVPRLIERRV